MISYAKRLRNIFLIMLRLYTAQQSKRHIAALERVLVVI